MSVSRALLYVVPALSFLSVSMFPGCNFVFNITVSYGNSNFVADS